MQRAKDIRAGTGAAACAAAANERAGVSAKVAVRADRKAAAGNVAAAGQAGLAELPIVSHQGRPQRGRKRASTLTAARRGRFLDALALTCNVERSAAHAGCHARSLYRLRQNDPGFADQWREAIALGYDRLEALVLQHGGAGVSLTGDPERAAEDGVAEPAFEFEKAMKILAFNRAGRNGEAKSHNFWKGSDLSFLSLNLTTYITN